MQGACFFECLMSDLCLRMKNTRCATHLFLEAYTVCRVLVPLSGSCLIFVFVN